METVDTSARLAALRASMKKHGVDIYVVPSEDNHHSEYIAACDGRRAFISGFSGSAGTAIVTHEKAALNTDGRYFNQAEKQLDQNWQLLKTGIQDVPTWQEWTATQSAGGKTVAVDPTLIASPVAEKLEESIKKSGGAGLVALSENLVDQVWGADRPPRPSQPVMYLSPEYSGKDTGTKLADLRKELAKKKAAGFVVSLLDDIAWLFNLRGSDIPYNPVFYSYAIVTDDSATLYINSSKLSAKVKSYLDTIKVSFKPYDEFFVDTKVLASSAEAEGETSPAKKYLISGKASWALKLALGGGKFVEEARSPIGDAKAVKNETELSGMRNCHIRDGAALSQFFAWLEDQLVNKKAVLDEVAVADKLEEFRSKQKDFVGLSFDTISSTGPNAAVIHYKPEPGNCSVVDPNAIYLCDSGAQYKDGTTDTTRTLHFGTPTPAEKKAYTLVLKGNIALDTAVFPKGTNGFAIDCLARQFLWKAGLDYRHGTGHGVGSFLNVHEGPIGIGTRRNYIDVPLAPGNVVSIEPGFYEDGTYGIRIENIAMVREVKTEHTFGDKPYFGFEHVTMVPYCRNLIDVSLLTPEEKEWLNDSNKEILAKTEAFFKDTDPLTHSWLVRETQPF
ncbi:peptidase M24, structural domain-containing protein [Lasiosphaeria miniovina]|uniref:Probable Xaa-Pro aminopeptidase P n=1 Tax=Lasiosphaeria miniovina TaxID=1954250 RepID=A0AA40AM74_9PEZI|nr:peptidase M24, structural domain-containing protein [Lasiosphaeria miniovina]KAK0718365.1 peptidase M24, structural domain-containing protein [Lasiosphaeria miniovina]